MTYPAVVSTLTPSDAESNPSFLKLLDAHLEYLRSKHYSESTIAIRRIRLGMFAGWCSDHGVSRPGEIARNTIEQYQQYLFRYHKRSGEPLSWSTQRSRLISLGVWLKWMARTGVLPHNPFAEVDLPRPVYKLPEFLTATESEAVLHRASASRRTGLRDRAVMETLYSTGIRRTELLRLKLQDIDIERGVVAIRAGKGNRDRVVPVGERCLAWITRYLAEVRPYFLSDPTEQTVFLTSHGRPFTPNHLSGLVRNYVAAAKVPKRGACHLFRHSMATLMLEGGADIRFIQQMLGHARLDSTQIYTHVSIPVLKVVHTQTHPASRLRVKNRKFTVVRLNVPATTSRKSQYTS